MTKYYELGSCSKNMLGDTNEENKYDITEDSYICDFDSTTDSHMSIMRQIRQNSEVLDIGCASGVMGELLKKYKDCIVDGIEYDMMAFKVAKKKKVYRSIYNFSIVDKNSKEFKNFLSLKRKYDFIIFGDVLEHLYEPWEALVNVAPLLKKDGSIIISLPNISNIDIIRALFNNEFNYQSLGLLDTTHIRFFTSYSFVDMIKNISKNYNINYNIELCDEIFFCPPYLNEEKVFDIFQINTNINDFLVLQNIFKLTLSNNKNIKIKGVKLGKNYFSSISEYLINKDNELNNYKELLELKNEEINKIKKQLTNVTNKLEKVKNDYNVIIRSKGWILLEKLRAIRYNIIHIFKK